MTKAEKYKEATEFFMDSLVDKGYNIFEIMIIVKKLKSIPEVMESYKDHCIASITDEIKAKPKNLTLKGYWECNSSTERIELIEQTYEYIKKLEQKLLNK